MFNRTAVLEIAVPFIAAQEGFRGQAYQDGAGLWTIGYGHRGGVKEGDKIGEMPAQALLRADCSEFCDYIEPHLPDQNPNQFAALLSLSFNIGLGGKGVKDGFLLQKTGEPSTILSLIQAKADPFKIGDAFLHWIYVAGVPSSGLCSRRTRERALYLTPYVDGPSHALDETPGAEVNGSPSDSGENSSTKGT